MGKLYVSCEGADLAGPLSHNLGLREHVLAPSDKQGTVGNEGANPHRRKHGA